MPGGDKNISFWKTMFKNVLKVGHNVKRQNICGAVIGFYQYVKLMVNYLGYLLGLLKWFLADYASRFWKRRYFTPAAYWWCCGRFTMAASLRLRFICLSFIGKENLWLRNRSGIGNMGFLFGTVGKRLFIRNRQGFGLAAHFVSG